MDEVAFAHTWWDAHYTATARYLRRLRWFQRSNFPFLAEKWARMHPPRVASTLALVALAWSPDNF